MHGYRLRMRAPSASLLKAMALVAYLNLPSVRDRRSARPRPRPARPDDPALRQRYRGRRAADGRLEPAVPARRTGRLLDFSFAWPIWGNSTTSARDQARFFYRIDRLVPRRHRGYALGVLANIVPSQRWGIPPARPPGWSIHFKGGWGSGTGLVAHQSALLRRDGRRLALSVLTRWNPSHRYGTTTIQGVAARLLARPLPLAPEYVTTKTRSPVSLTSEGCGDRRG